MTPQPNNHIIIVLVGGFKLDGILVSWDENEAVLRSKTGSITTTIIDPLVNVLYYQIINSEEQYENVKAKPIKGPDEIKELAELKNELNYVEREEIANKFRTHELSGAKSVSYEPINIASIPVLVQHPSKEVAKPNRKFGESLQGVQWKKQS